MFWKKKIAKVDFTPFVRRLVDLTTPNKLGGEECRATMRYNRSLPTVVIPCLQSKPQLDKLRLGITTDLSDFGIGINLVGIPPQDEVIVAFHLPSVEGNQPWCFQCLVVNSRRTAGDIYHVGCEIADFLNLSQPATVANLTSIVMSALDRSAPSP